MKIIIILAFCFTSTSWSTCIPGSEGSCEDAKNIDITEMALFSGRSPSGSELDQTQDLDMARESSVDMLVDATK